MTTGIEGKVARILNDQELVINLGKDHGVSKGMRFAIFGPTEVIIRDPDTGKILDRLDQEKIRVEADEVRNSISICKTYGGVVVGGAFSNSVFDLFKPKERIPNTFRATEHPASLEEDESFVKIGDIVRALGGAKIESKLPLEEGVSVETAASLPTNSDLSFLAEIQAFLAERGVRPGDSGFSETVLTAEIETRGWTYTLTQNAGAWDARIATASNLGVVTNESLAEGYWDQVSALSVALAQALHVGAQPFPVREF